MKRKAIDYISPTQKITFSFLGVIIIGAILLSLPICSKDRNSINFIDALFISTSATCVTGLVTKIIMHQFNLLGQIIILALIQIGGIGELAPNQRKNLARLGVKALICGTLVSYMSAAIAGILI